MALRICIIHPFTPNVLYTNTLHLCIQSLHSSSACGHSVTPRWRCAFVSFIYSLRTFYVLTHCTHASQPRVTPLHAVFWPRPRLRVRLSPDCEKRYVCVVSHCSLCLTPFPTTDSSESNFRGLLQISLDWWILRIFFLVRIALDCGVYNISMLSKLLSTGLADTGVPGRIALCLRKKLWE